MGKEACRKKRRIRIMRSKGEGKKIKKSLENFRVEEENEREKAGMNTRKTFGE